MTLRQLNRTQARDLIAAAVKAPSSHNTQPWRFRIRAQQVSVLADRSRALPVNDPDDRELTISCGAAAFTLGIAAGHLGLDSSVERVPDGNQPDLLCTVTFADRDAGTAGEGMYRAIARRHTTRAGFSGDRVPEMLVAAMAEAAGVHGARFDVLGPHRRALVADLVAAGDRAQFSNPRWRRELASWMRPRSSGDGLAVPAPITPVVRTVLTHLDLGRRTAKGDHHRAMAAPVLAVLGTEGDGVEDWLIAGEALQHVLLVAAAEGVQAGFSNQPCQVPALRARLAGRLEPAGHPQVVLRLGYPTKPLPAASRRRVDAVIERASDDRL